MRLAILADIHSNLHALKAVRDEIEKAKIDSVACAGDIVGYGANPNECCALVRQMAVHLVFGNHERAALTRDTIWMNPHAAKASAWTSDALSPDSREFLSSLELESRFEVRSKKVAMFHGSVGSDIEYVYYDQLSEELPSKAGADILILAHTHVPYVRRFKTSLVLNPGSVGQPRDGDPRASYGIYDSEDDSCDIRRVRYDVEGAYEAILSRGLPDFLAERLFFGR
jgi:putative phosphoesterase